MMDGPAGTGKTFTECAISAHIRAQNKLNLCTASTGIAELILVIHLHSLLAPPPFPVTSNDVPEGKLASYLPMRVILPPNRLLPSRVMLILMRIFVVVCVGSLNSYFLFLLSSLYPP